MPCSLCGTAGHNLKNCELPGRDKLLKALALARAAQKLSKQPQKGRKPPRLGGVTPKRFREKKKKQYSGNEKVEQQRKANREAERKTKGLPQTADMQKTAVTELQSLGFLKSVPKRCSECKRGTFRGLQVTSTYQCFWRCNEPECRKRMNALDLASWLPPAKRRRGCSPFQMMHMLKQYASVSHGKPVCFRASRQAMGQLFEVKC